MTRERLLYKPQLWMVILLSGIVIGGIFLRFFHLTDTPPGLHFDEGAHGFDALSFLAGNHTPFSWEGGGREALFAYMVAIAVEFFGREPFAIRLPAALASSLSVLGVAYLGKSLFRDEGTALHAPSRLLIRYKHSFIALTAAALLATSLNQIIVGRAGWRANYLILLLSFAVPLLWRGMVRQNRTLLVLAGILTGLLPYTYIPARLFPLLLLLFTVSFFLLRQIRIADVRRLRSSVGLYLVVSGAVALPILLFFILQPAAFFYRSQYLWILEPNINRGAPWETILESLLSHMTMFGLTGDSRLTYNYRSLPFLSLPVSVFFWIGLFCTVRYWKQPSYRFSFLWLIVMVIPGIASYDDNPPNYLRLAGAVPIIFIIAALGYWHVLAALESFVFSWRREALRWVHYGLVFFLIFLPLYKGVQTYNLYFNGWATEEELFSTYQVPIRDLAADLETLPQPPNVVTVVPYSNFNLIGHLYNFEFLYEGSTPVSLFRTADTEFPEDLQAAIASTVRTAESPIIHAVQWYTNDSADATEVMDFLLGKYANFEGSQDRGSYSIHIYSSPRLDRPWNLYHELAPYPVLFDTPIALTHAAMGLHGGEQFTQHRIAIPALEDPLWVVNRWQVEQPLQQQYRLSLRLYDAEGRRVHMEEYPLLDIFARATNAWDIGAGNETYHLFPALPSLEPGRYQLRMLLYDVDTLAPAVQLNVWEPEVLLLEIDLGGVVP